MKDAANSLLIMTVLFIFLGKFFDKLIALCKSAKGEKWEKNEDPETTGWLLIADLLMVIWSATIFISENFPTVQPK